MRKSLILLVSCVLYACAGLENPTPQVPSIPTFTVAESTVLSGDPVAIRLVGLDPGAEVMVTAERVWAHHPPALYRSVARFFAGGDGALDLRTAAPTEAPWAGVDPRGPFWSMTRTDDPVPAGRSHEEVHFAADVDGDDVADVRTVVRLVAGRDDLVETPLGPEFPGAFLLRPPGSDLLPAVIVLGGSEGGDSSARRNGPKLASRGYAVVGLPYYSPAWYGGEQQFPELPAAFHDIPLDRIEAVRDWLRQRDDIVADRIALNGGSKGAELALAAASRIDGFAAVVANVPSDVIWEGWGPGTVAGKDSSFSWRSEPLPFVPYLGMAAEFAKFGTDEPVRLRTPHDAGRAAHPHRVAAARIRVEDIDEPVFLVGGDEDDVWDSGGMARNILTARDAAGLVTVAIIDSEAGHQLSGDGYYPAGAAEARVQGEAFPAMLEFLERYLKR